MKNLTNKQKNDLGKLLFGQASNIVESWGETDLPESLKDVDVNVIADQIVTWFLHIPHDKK